jgi:hypothetical protein
MKKYDTRFYTILFASIAFLLLFKNVIIDVLVGLGDYIDFSTPAFYIGYVVIGFMTIATSVIACNKKYIPNKSSTFFIVIIVVLYLYLRIFEADNIYFKPILSFILYTDLVIILAAIFAWNLYQINKKVEIVIPENLFFLQDTVFENSDLTNEKILQKLISTVHGFKPEVAFSIGINAIWGYGKSSFLNKFKSDYSRKNPEAIVFWYRVWKNKGVNSIIENFFEELNNSLKPYSGELDSEFKGYVDSILHLPSTELSKLINLGRDALNGKDTLEKYFQSINQAIAKIDRQIIVLLDDMDRLEQEEILNTLKLIRTLSDFNNLIFIVGYDRKYLVDTIEKKKENYLDKVFNVEINLLPFDENQITQMLFSKVDEIFPEKESNDLDITGFNNGFKSLFNKSGKSYPVNINLDLFLGEACTDYELKFVDFLDSFRDIKRFINEFKFNASFLESENDIIHVEYILLKLLTYKYRFVQDLILNKMVYLFSRGKINWESGKISEGFGFSYDVWLYDDKTKEQVKSILTKSSYEQHFNVINATLCRLFGKSSLAFYEENQNSISKVYHTDLYIRNDIASGNITITQIRKAFEQAELHILVNNIHKDPSKKEFTIQNELKYFIFKNQVSSKGQFEDVVLSLNMFMSFGVNNDDDQVLEILLYGLEHFYLKKRKLFIEFIKEVLVKCDVGYLDEILSDINVNIKREEHREKNPASIINYENNFFTPEEIKYLQFAKLKAFIDKEYEVDDVIRAYHFMVEKIIDNKVLRPFTANDIIKKEIINKFDLYYNTYLFIMISDRANHSDAEVMGYQPNDFLVQIFASKKAYKKLIANLNPAEAFAEFKRDGVKNLLSFLRSLQFNEPKEQFKIENTIKIIMKFISNDYKPLNRKEYDSIWNNDIAEDSDLPLLKT